MRALSSFLLIGLTLLSFPLYSQNLRPGCYFFKDSSQITHFKAKDLGSYYTCFGHFHGLNDTLAMDFMRRKALGTTAELKGQSEVYEDFFMRMLNLEKLSKNIYQNLNPKLKENLVSYANGVNQGFKVAIKRRPPAYDGHFPHPEKWLPQHTMAIILLKIWEDSKKDFFNALKEQDLLQRYEKLALSYFSKKNATHFSYKIYDKKVNITSNLLTHLRPLSPTDIQWAIAPFKMEDQNAWLGHKRTLSSSSNLLYRALHAENNNVSTIGLTIPGVPLFFQGTNKNLSWALAPSPLKKIRLSFVPSEDFQAHVIYPTIKIRVGNKLVPYQYKSYEVTTKGHPIIPMTAPKGTKALLSWLGHSLKSSDFEPLFKMDRLKRWEDLENLFNHKKPGPWSFLFSDSEGNIGQTAFSESTPNLGIQLKSYQDLLKKPFFKKQEPTFIINPQKGLLTSSLGHLFPQKENGFEDFEKVQCAPNNRVPHLLQYLLPLAKRSIAGRSYRKALDLLKRWDKTFKDNCKACSLYEKWTTTLQQETRLTKDELHFFLRKGPQGIKKNIQRSLKKTVQFFKKGFRLKIPLWKDFKRNKKPFLPKSDHKFLVKMGDHPKVYLSSCPLQEASYPTNWDKENLQYIRFNLEGPSTH